MIYVDEMYACQFNNKQQRRYRPTFPPEVLFVSADAIYYINSV